MDKEMLLAGIDAARHGAPFSARELELLLGAEHFQHIYGIEPFPGGLDDFDNALTDIQDGYPLPAVIRYSSLPLEERLSIDNTSEEANEGEDGGEWYIVLTEKVKRTKRIRGSQTPHHKSRDNRNAESHGRIAEERVEAEEGDRPVYKHGITHNIISRHTKRPSKEVARAIDLAEQTGYTYDPNRIASATHTNEILDYLGVLESVRLEAIKKYDTDVVKAAARIARDYYIEHRREIDDMTPFFELVYSIGEKATRAITINRGMDPSDIKENYSSSARLGRKKLFVPTDVAGTIDALLSHQDVRTQILRQGLRLAYSNPRVALYVR